MRLATYLDHVTHFERPLFFPSRLLLAITCHASHLILLVSPPPFLHLPPPSPLTHFLGWIRLGPVAPKPYDWSYTDHELVSRCRMHAPPHLDRSPSIRNISPFRKGVTVYRVQDAFVRFLSPFALDSLLSVLRCPFHLSSHRHATTFSFPLLACIVHVFNPLAWPQPWNPPNHRPLILPIPLACLLPQVYARYRLLHGFSALRERRLPISLRHALLDS